MQEVTIKRLGHQGDGIAPGPVFVPRTLPGEIVRGEIGAGRMAAPKIVAASPDRVASPCPHYGACGGCALLHARDAFVAAWKQEVVRTALAAQGLSVPFDPIATSPPGSRRRAVLSGRRTRTGAVVGFHGRASDALCEVPHCLILTDGIRTVLPVLRDLVIAGGSRKGEMGFAVIDTESGVDVAAHGGKPVAAGVDAELAQIVSGRPVARLSWDGEVVVQAAPPWVRFGTARVVPPPGAFLQATREGEAALLSSVGAVVGGASRIADLFAGCGTFALPLARHAEILAVENEASMLAALAAGWRVAQGLKAVATEVRDLFRVPITAGELSRFDAVVIDPPRAGAAAQSAELARSAVPRIAAVSCNPVTFARDAAVLVAGGYRLDRVRVVDQFRWSPHVELAAQFTRD
ncbi:MAG: class I SAM-dependent RNA methyltransferase [Rhodobacteraceae bacterium]|nr:class I SAM-dependent RNA methyltransferase [Paracoccaceae bacterium]